MRRKKHKWDTGDIFVIPLEDGTVSLGQVVWVAQSLLTPICAIFDFRISRNDLETNLPELSDEKLLTVQLVTRDSLESGFWAVVANKPPFKVDRYINIENLESAQYLNVKIIGSGNIIYLVNAYNGLADRSTSYDPQYLTKLLVPKKRPNEWF